MWRQSRIAVVVPAYCEARIIGRMLRRLPGYVDAVFVVDDASPDETSSAALAVGDPRVVALRHAVNRGVGAAIVTGYRAALEAGSDVAAVMAGDDQMHPDDLEAVLAPVVGGLADYVKGNRFVHPEARRMPVLRRLGGEMLSFSTRRATGLSVSDTQCGFTAISAPMLRRLPLGELWPRYGYPNDLLGLLSSHGARVREVPVRPVYADETSGLRAFHVASILGVIARRYLREKRRASLEP
ncbi:MAG TPA: glycosyltransferase family 2 protein [Polyangiaceae bacterium]|nr:glycosyltransferase family 2 protein [Polyangiaceae bacterium]